MDKIKVIKKLNDTAENFRKDIPLFSQDSDRPATEADLYRLAVMNYYAISDITDAVKAIIG